MSTLLPRVAISRPSSSPRKYQRDTYFLIGDLLPILDVGSVLLAASLATMAYVQWFALGTTGGVTNPWGALITVAVLTPLVLCDRAFVAFASSGQTGLLIRSTLCRFVLLLAAAAAVGYGSRLLDGAAPLWLLLWAAFGLLLVASTRTLMFCGLRRLERHGVLSETIAVVGEGPVTDQLIRHLRQTRRGRVDILGPFDDAPSATQPAYPAVGSVTDLIVLGQQRAIDWILLTDPENRGAQIAPTVHRLKALSVPMGLCPQIVGDIDGLPLSPRRRVSRSVAEAVVPRWIITLLSLPVAAATHLMQRQPSRPAPAPATPPAAPPLRLTLDAYDLPQFVQRAAQFEAGRFGYVVTPNADHLIRLHREPSFRALYDEAAYVLLDSRFIAHLMRLTQRRVLPVCTGSDLTAALFDEVIQPADRIVLIGGSVDQAATLTTRYGLTELVHFNPPMGFVHDPLALENCLQFVEAHSPFRFCLLAVGAPQQEVVAQQLKARGQTQGLAFCIGASINFMTGEERRAPLWMQRSGMEWLYRLVQAPRRMAGRYLVRGPQLFLRLRHTEVVLRPAVPAVTPALTLLPDRSIRRIRSAMPLRSRRVTLALMRSKTRAALT